MIRVLYLSLKVAAKTIHGRATNRTAVVSWEMHACMQMNNSKIELAPRRLQGNKQKALRNACIAPKLNNVMKHDRHQDGAEHKPRNSSNRKQCARECYGCICLRRIQLLQYSSMRHFKCPVELYARRKNTHHTRDAN